MQEILKEYGPALLTVVAIIALLVLITALIGTDEEGVVGGAFQTMLNTFFTKAMNTAGGAPAPTVP